jgi:hypothetical protein
MPDDTGRPSPGEVAKYNHKSDAQIPRLALNRPEFQLRA